MGKGLVVNKNEKKELEKQLKEKKHEQRLKKSK